MKQASHAIEQKEKMLMTRKQGDNEYDLNQFRTEPCIQQVIDLQQ